MLDKGINDQKAKAKKELIVLGSIVLIGILFIIISSVFDNSGLEEKDKNNEKNNETEKTTLESLEDNYDIYYEILLNDELIKKDIRISKKDKAILTYDIDNKFVPYICLETNCYQVDMEKETIKKVDEPKMFENIDLTFLEISNILKLIKRSNLETKNGENIYTISLIDVVKEYNFITFSNVDTEIEENIEIKVKYVDTKIEINYSLDPINKLLSGKEDKIDVYIRIENIGNVDFSDFKKFIENKL